MGAHARNNNSKSSFQNPRPGREFIEVQKEINAMNKKLFKSTDSVMNTKSHKISKAGLNKTFLKKSGSIDSNSSNSIINEMLNEAEGNNKSESNLIKFKMGSQSKNKPQILKSKSKGPTTKRQRKGNKIYWDYLESKKNIRKYMKKYEEEAS